jgi:multiple sugar transport system substrate-binding protein
VSSTVRKFTRRDILSITATSAAAVLLQACTPQEKIVEKVITATPEPAKPAAAVQAPAAPTQAPAAQAPATQAPAVATKAPAPAAAKRLQLLRGSSFVPDEDKFFSEYMRDNWAKPNNVELVTEFIGGNDLQPKVAVAIESGSGPDVMNLLWNWAHLYGSKLLDVGAITTKQGTDGGGFHEVFRANSMVNNVWRTVPFGMAGNMFVYRTDWLKEVGETKFPDSWEEFNRVGKIMKDKKKAPTGQSFAHSTGDPSAAAYPLLWSFGGKEVLDDGRTVAINSPETIAAVEFAVKWFKDSLTPDMLGWDDGANNRAYPGEQIWATQNGASVYLTAKKDFPKVAEVSEHAKNPKGPAGSFHIASPDSYAIPAYVKDAATARDFLAFATDKKNYTVFMNMAAGYRAAPVKGYDDHPVWTKDPKMALFKDVSYYRWPGFPGAPSLAASEAWSKYIVVDMFAKAMQGEKPQNTVAWAEAELKRIYSK